MAARTRSFQYYVCSFVGHEIAFHAVAGSPVKLPTCGRCGRAAGLPGLEV